jgi:excisionase family DNA binding protein
MATLPAHPEGLSFADRIGKMKKLLTVREVAELLGENKFTIYRRCERGDMPHIKIRSSTKFDPAQLAKWLRDHYV